ncbi:MAG: hypothetical protein E6J42_00635 [Chloroflexi bacterium]|nr:MAG: hypothetical protein E6J42_00635 [Chloroflexota bacterium]
MGILDKLFGRKSEAAAPADKKPEVECPHAAITPRWNNAADMGKADLISEYMCESCHSSFNREDGEKMLALAADRMRVSEDERQEGMRKTER